MLSCRLCCLPLCLVVTSIFSVVFVTVVGTNAAREITSDTSSSTELSHPTALSTVGYVLGCFASFGHWWCEILCLRYGSQCTKEMFSNRLWKGGGVFLIIHDLFYILGILMQSGGIKIAIVSLPWLMGRVVQACFQLFKLSSTKWSKICMLDGSDREDGDDIEGCDDNIIDVEAVNLLGSSDSESSEIHVLWDRSWKIPGKPQVHVHYDELPTGHAHMSSSQGPVSTAHHAGASTTDSDWSSTSQEQELVWENFAPPSRLHLRNGIYAKSEFENLSQIAGLSEKHSETFDQRVRSWISQSTPEEETPPCLTMTLNLETNHDSIDDTHNINFGNRKVISPWSLRKNSY